MGPVETKQYGMSPLKEGAMLMEEKQSEAERTLWVIYASYCSNEINPRIERIFIYARDATEAEEIVHRWGELHPEYVIQRYEPSP